MDAQRILVLAAAFVAAPAIAQPVVVAGSQPEASAQAVISADAPGGTYVYDDQRVGQSITTPRDATIERIRFWGGSESDLGGDTNTLGFRLSVYEVDPADDSLSLVHQSRLGRGFALPTGAATTFGDFDAEMFRYEIDLSETPIEFVGQREYVVNLSAITFVQPRPARESWAWASAIGDGSIYIDLFDGAGLQQTSGIASGLAVELIGVMDEPDCIADVNQDGALTPADFTAWISAYNSGDSRADQNQDGSNTPADFTAWISNYNAGC